MVAMNSRNNMSKPLLDSCQTMLPTITFVSGKSFFWSPKTQSIHIDEPELETENGCWALLHEMAHALLGHSSYNSDAGLLALEVEAWEKAKRVAKKMGHSIDPEHIQDCLDTYRDWLYARSTCPTCALNSLQIAPTQYKCLNCSTDWSVSRSRFCRPYRMQSAHKKTPSEQAQTVFS